MRQAERERELRREAEPAVVPSPQAESDAHELASSVGNSAMERIASSPDLAATPAVAPLLSQSPMALGAQAFAGDRGPSGRGDPEIVGHELGHVEQQRQSLGEKPPPDDYELPPRDPNQVVGIVGAYGSEEERMQKEAHLEGNAPEPSHGEFTRRMEGKGEEGDEGVPELSLGYFQG
jgi:hypothetical protein